MRQRITNEAVGNDRAIQTSPEAMPNTNPPRIVLMETARDGVECEEGHDESREADDQAFGATGLENAFAHAVEHNHGAG
jgi:hypothetical protein